MKIEISKIGDSAVAAYILVHPGERAKQTKRVFGQCGDAVHVLIDIAESGRLLGVEILDLSGLECKEFTMEEAAEPRAAP